MRREVILRAGNEGFIYSLIHHSISTGPRHPAAIVSAPYHAIAHPNYLSPNTRYT